MSGEGVVVLCADDDFVAVDKAAGVATHCGWADDAEPMLQKVRDHVGGWVYPVHRLDRGASGVLLFARSAEVAALLSAQWNQGTVEKRYLALTRGHPPAQTVIDHPIPRQEGGPRVDAVTEVWCRQHIGRYALVEAAPRTGRLHQIRRHLKHISCPLIGDVRYGKGEHNRLFRQRHNLHRLALHASRLAFDHPRGGSRIVVEAPLADDIANAIASCMRDGS